ncbi:MAG TPA: YqjK family protein [Rugosibacter sp.]|nr:YqjK family protein [Rugosibacter sp.]
MNSKALELALKKQRVKIASLRLREEFLVHLEDISPACHTADQFYKGAVWLRQHPQILIGAAIALIVAKPKRVLTWSRRIVSSRKLFIKFGRNAVFSSILAKFLF